MRALAAALLLSSLCVACGTTAAATPPPAAPHAHHTTPAENSANAAHVDDPAHVAGTWTYTTSSTCDDLTAHGEIVWSWDHATAEYTEVGWAEWDVGDPMHVDWTCALRWDATTDELVGVCPEKTGESTTVRWREMPTAGAAQAWELAWTTTAGCSYSGIARR